MHETHTRIYILTIKLLKEEYSKIGKAEVEIYTATTKSKVEQSKDAMKRLFPSKRIKETLTTTVVQVVCPYILRYLMEPYPRPKGHHKEK